MWVKLDLGFFRNPKTLAIGADARLLYLAALCYAGERLTDGFIPEDALPLVAAEAQVADPCAAVARLVKAGFWQVVAGGHRIHDYFDYNRPARAVKANREAGRARASARRTARNQPRQNASPGEMGTQNVRAYESRTVDVLLADDARTNRVKDTDTDTELIPPPAPPVHTGGEHERPRVRAEREARESYAEWGRALNAQRREREAYDDALAEEKAARASSP